MFSRRNTWIVCSLLLACSAALCQEPAAEPEQSDPYAVPEGTSAELTKFIQNLMQQPPPTPQAREKVIAAMLEASGKILAAKPTPDEAEFAVYVKTNFTRKIEQLQAFAKQLKAAGRADLARQVRAGILRRQLAASVRGPAAGAANNLGKQIDEIKKFLAEGPLTGAGVNLAMEAAQAAEMVGDTRLAADAYGSFAKMFAASKNGRIAAMAKTMEGVVRRLTLLGKEMKVEGTILGGGKLDWSKYRGRVVLVDFWATWCGPCLQQIPVMKKNYELYRDQGFEIIGISLDDDRERLEGFVTGEKIPWPIVFGEDGPSPTVNYYAVMSIPQMILVDKSGKVVSLEARGPELGRQLEKLLGPAKKKEAGEKKSKKSTLPASDKKNRQ